MLGHEIGHHLQKITGLEGQVRQAKRNLLETGDVEEGLGAAAAIGDDRMQRISGQYVNPDAFTHGSSAQRVEWFRRGLSTGDLEVCDTFAAAGS